MKVIDSHIHFWDVANGFNEWVEKSSLPKIVTPEGLNAQSYVHIEAHGEHHSSLCEYNWLKNAFPNDNIKVIAFLDFTLPMGVFEKNLTILSACPDIVGVRQIMAASVQSRYSPFKKELPRDLRKKLTLLATHGMIFEAQMYPEQFLPLLDDINASNVTMAVEHMGLPVMEWAKKKESWLILLNELAHHKNWVLKLSGLDILNKTEHTKPCIEIICETIPYTQLCYGSNYPVSHPESYKNWQGTLNEHVDGDEAKANIFSKTASRIYFS